MEITFSIDEITAVASKLMEQISSKTILFYGDMGVGKTTIIKELAKIIGVTENLSSPTFSIVNEYQAKECLLYHFDCYRLTNQDEALDIGIEDYLNSGHYTFIEWPQNIENLLPTNSDRINLILNANGSRTAILTPKV
ncbi:tRNA (adenosine(37)-N6)-threonylcarbamoyltransferase complex ATPase subunit type 1 TsaE [Flavobacteriaceae bacterium]|jgi:tRNA threonylcarbamoyladenosine biosynthesis protein TsaE|nr:tRNA (adenosine(37)-N6)-threonylcarbamoyltransferase complex ATPase subunit type 1 TsaE [Flavobacteriaceae bacterium]|tara:strand:+ start:694 stop:1107 length:414 start_codon:yes stop_codon:yes gene_type:complete